jgi:hypothetical protein
MATLGTQYQDVLSAIESYYGSGSDQWAGFAKYGIAYENAEATLSQIPGVDVFKNNAGQITGYAYNNPFSDSSAGIAGEINSNLQVPTQGNGTTFSGAIPANSTINGTTGKLEISSGAKSTATGASVSSVLGRIGTGVAAVATGAKLGAFIDSVIYNAAPDYWDRTFPAINPETWDTIAGENKAGQKVINALFGINKANNKTQMYIPEEAFAYLAYAMSQENFFGNGNEQATISDTSILKSKKTTNYLPFQCASNAMIAKYGGVYRLDSISGTDIKITAHWTTDDGGAQIIVSSKSPQTVTFNIYDTDADRETPDTQTLKQVNGYPNPLYMAVRYFFSIRGAISPEPFSGLTSNYTTIEQDLAYIMQYGTVNAQTRDGVNIQPDASLPDRSNWTSPQATAQNIRTQYPDLYQNSLYTDVAQQDGTTTRIYYYPVPATATNSATQTQPTNDTVTQNSPSYVDTTSTDDLIKTILRYIYQTETRTKDDTPTPPDTPNPTDTGDGDTPTIVPPTGQASSLFAIYNPTQAELNSFGAWLWSSNFVDQILKLFNDPMQSIIGLHKIFAAPPISGASTIHVGYLDSGVSSATVGAQYTTIDCGSVRVREQFGNVFDYSDTDVRLYLPFIGIVPLDVMDVMRGTVSVIYHVDVITGACLAEVRVTRDASGGTLYQYAGDAAVRYPISSGSYMGVVSGVLGVVGGIASGIMSGGATLPLMAGAAGAMAGAKTHVQHSGSFAGNAGAMGAKKPYLILERPQTAIAKNYKGFQGVGTNEIHKVGDMDGYFKMNDVRLNSVQGASDSELETIRALLEQGVIA